MKVHIKDVKIGDIVLHDGKWRTVGAKDIKEDPFMGRTLFGDSYQLGYKSVTLFCNLRGSQKASTSV